MNRKAFFLGFFSTGGQVLLLRELVASFNGDELFIGTALFGWLLTVALGAFWGGRLRKLIPSSGLFIIGVLILWSDIILTRLSPMLLGKIPGEIFPFTTAALLSIIFMAPVGVISGWLFTAITRESRTEATVSIVTVYLYEGVGAFVGGFKYAVTKQINILRNTPSVPVWQRNYYEHVVRNEEDLDTLRRYIDENPLRWTYDEENPINRG